VYLWTVVEALKYPAYFSWVLWCSFLVIGFQGFFYRVHRSQVRANNVEFVIVSIGSINVRCSLFETIKHTALFFPELPLYVIVEQGSELLVELENLITSDYMIPIRDAIATCKTTLSPSSKPMIEIVAVPKKYRPELIAKGRAINYFIENYVVTSKWYTFIDDDLILDGNFLYEISYYGPRGYVACNPILTTRKGKSNLTYVIDNIRIFDDFSIFRLFTGLLHTPLLGLHGEALTAKGSVLKEIGYTRKTITEDFSFASEIVKSKKQIKI
jgi:beta-1,4-mannosyltransferase